MESPICKICNDTHRMHLEETGIDRQCTHCPLPCPECRGGPSGYCAKTPCACACHRKAAP